MYNDSLEIKDILVHNVWLKLAYIYVFWKKSQNRHPMLRQGIQIQNIITL